MARKERDLRCTIEDTSLDPLFFRQGYPLSRIARRVAGLSIKGNTASGTERPEIRIFAR
jgi:hypothetical protein